MSPNTVYTIGHSTRQLEEFIQLLQAYHIARVVDIRTIPRSRHNPQFNEDTLPAALSSAEIGYTHLTGLGGLRHARRDSINTGWQNASFRGFADYMQTAEFETSVTALIRMAEQEFVCLMCAEAVPWRCHRSLIADALLVQGIPVEHILGLNSHRPHTLTPWARLADGHLTYPAPDSQ